MGVALHGHGDRAVGIEARKSVYHCAAPVPAERSSYLAQVLAVVVDRQGSCTTINAIPLVAILGLISHANAIQ